MATVGQQLATQESGWRRYDDMDSRILYEGTWSRVSTAACYNGTETNSANSSIKIVKFKFFGTKFRIIGNIYTTYKKVTVSVNGATVGTYTPNGALTRQVLLYEYIGSSVFQVNNVVLSWDVTSTESAFDAIDIDATGYLMHPMLNQVSDIKTMKVGDCVPCKYTATTSGAAGYFSEIGTCTSDEIPVSGSATPNGLFYFIKTENGTLVADRAVQHSISWDILNAAKYIEGILSRIDSIIPKLTSDDCVIDGVRYVAKSSTVYGSNYFAHSVFNKTYTSTVLSEWIASIYTLYGLVSIDIGVSKIPAAYSITGTTGYATANTSVAPKNWTIDGSNDAENWHVLDSQTNQTSWTFGETRYYTLNLSNGYRYFRINISANNGSSSYLALGEFDLYSTNTLTIIRSLSGGCSYSDESEKSSLTDKSKGGWPTSNEWDKYIVNSTLDGKITKGDDKIWHWSTYPYGTICKDTPVLAWLSSTNRIHRGATASNVARLDGVSYNVSSNAHANQGFRPVLNYLETNSKATNLYY